MEKHLVIILKTIIRVNNFCKKIVEYEKFKSSIQDLLASNYKKQKTFWML